MINWGEYVCGYVLLDKCLMVVIIVLFGGWLIKESDWKIWIYFVKGEVELVVRLFVDYVVVGYGVDFIVILFIYVLLKDYLVF